MKILNSKIATTPLALLVAMGLFCCSHAVAETEEQEKALQLLRKVMATDWGYLDLATKRKGSESADEFEVRTEQLLEDLIEKDKKICGALKNVIRLETPEVERILQFFADDWITSQDLQKWLGQLIRWRKLDWSTGVAFEEVFRRMIGRVPQEKLLDHLTQLTLGPVPVSDKLNLRLRSYTAVYVEKNYDADQVVQAFSRWAQDDDLADRLLSDNRYQNWVQARFEHLVASNRKDPLPREDLVSYALKGPAIVRWLAIDSLARLQDGSAFKLALQLLREASDIPSIEGSMLYLLVRRAPLESATMLAALDFVSRRIEKGKFHPANFGTYSMLGEACEDYRRGRRLLEFVRDNTKDEKLKAWVIKKLAEIPEGTELKDIPEELLATTDKPVPVVQDEKPPTVPNSKAPKAQLEKRKPSTSATSSGKLWLLYVGIGIGVFVAVGCTVVLMRRRNKS